MRRDGFPMNHKLVIAFLCTHNACCKGASSL